MSVAARVRHASVHFTSSWHSHTVHGMQFRPKNFAKPAQVKTEEGGPSSAVAVKQEPVSPRVQARKSPHQGIHRRKNVVLTHDTVTFGGGVGGMCCSVCIDWWYHV